MWQCGKCREQVEEHFEVCWNCGTSREGVEDPTFRKADDLPADLGPPSASAPDAPRPEVAPRSEFTPQDQALFGELAVKMRFVGLFLIVAGVLQGLTVCAGHLGGIISGLISILLGVWTRSAADSFASMATAAGRDVSHLMNALGDLLKLYRLQYYLLVIGLVLLALVIPLALLVVRSR
jgi:hypothetical protein